MKRINFVGMDVQATRIELAKLILSETSEKMLQLIDELYSRKSQEKEWELTDAHKKLLDERLARHKANPEEGSSWEEVKERIIPAPARTLLE